MGKKKVLFIINPRSGGQSHGDIEAQIEKYLDRSRYEWQVRRTESADDALQASCKAAGNSDVVVAVGGDGSVNQAARGLIGSPTVLGIIPTGSGNGLARHLNISTRIPDAIDTLNRGHIKTIDTASFNDEIYVNMAGVGFDGHVAHVFSRSRARGFLSYLKCVVKEYFHYHAREYELSFDETTLQKEAFLISFANSCQYGNNAYIAPLAKIDDGLLEVCILERFPRWAAPIIAVRLFNKTIHRSSYYTCFQCREITVHQEKALEAHIDGDPLLPGPRLEIKINPRSLKVISGADH